MFHRLFSSRRRTVLTGCFISLLGTTGFFASSAHAADPWPVKPVRYIVPFAAGGLADAVARVIGPPLWLPQTRQAPIGL